MFKISLYLVSLIFPVFIGWGVFNNSSEDKSDQGFQYLKESHSTALILQELGVIDREILKLKPNVAFPQNQLRALLLLASHERALISDDNASIQLDRDKLAINRQLQWKEWVQQLDLSSLDREHEVLDHYYWSQKLSDALNNRIASKDIYLTSLFVDEHRLR